MEIYSVSGNLFEPPAFRNFSLAGWTQTGGSMGSVATGPTAANLQFDIIFLDPQQSPTSFDFMAFSGTTMVDNARATWNGGWSFRPLSSAEQTAHVPEPLDALTLLAGAAVSIAAVLRRRRCKA